MKRISILIFSLALAACSSDQKPAAAGNATGAATPAGTLATLKFEPDTFENCTPAKPVAAMIRWDASKSGSVAVDIVTLGSDGVVGKFATGGAVGEKESGPWMTPGIVIAVRDSATGKELTRTMGKSKPCSH